MSILKNPIKSDEYDNFILHVLERLEMDIDDLSELSNLSPYLILDGHRTGIQNNNMIAGYMEGAAFSLRFASIFKKLQGKQATFLIHTLRNYKTLSRMDAIFDAVENIGREFIKKAYQGGIKLQYYGHDVHDGYALSKIINKAESITNECDQFNLNFLTNYSEEWGYQNLGIIDSLPEITVIGRFTKGHYSGAGIPGKATKANFNYIQQASVNENWNNEQIITLILSLLKSHISLKGFVGGKSYKTNEKDLIYTAREIDLWEGEFNLVDLMKEGQRKRMTTFSPLGPITVRF